MLTRRRKLAALVTMVAPLAALASAGPASAHDGDDRPDRRDGVTVYTQTNAAAGNAVLALRFVRGSFVGTGAYDTGGIGAGTGLGSQGAVVADDDHVLAVNAGSNEVSLFDIGRDGGLELLDVAPSGGERPVSVTVHDDVVYVANVTSRNVTGLRIKGDRLVPIAGSTRDLPGNGVGQISFDAEGERLVVTQKATNTIDVLRVRRGVAGPAVSNPSTGPTPFGFAVDRRNHVVVSNAAGGAAGASTVSSYDLTGRTTLTPLSSAVATTQTAACWIALSTDERFAYAANAGSGSVSSYRLGRDGSVSLLEAVAATPGQTALDMATTDRMLFALAGGSHTVSAYAIGRDGSLALKGQVDVPVGVAGLTAG